MLQGTNASTARVRVRAYLAAVDDGPKVYYSDPRTGKEFIDLAPTEHGIAPLYIEDLRAILDEVPGEPGTQEEEPS